MKKTVLLMFFAAATCIVLPSCDSARENNAEATEERADEVEDAADDSDAAGVEDKADNAGDAADDRE